jgi:hypothetical protein
VRFRRAQGAEHQQIKWVALAGVFAVLITAESVPPFLPELRAIDPDMTSPPAMFLGVPFVLALVALPLAAAIAILRYRLYDIDRLISRTFTYGVLWLGIALAYLGLRWIGVPRVGPACQSVAWLAARAAEKSISSAPPAMPASPHQRVPAPAGAPSPSVPILLA